MSEALLHGLYTVYVECVYAYITYALWVYTFTLDDGRCGKKKVVVVWCGVTLTLTLILRSGLGLGVSIKSPPALPSPPLSSVESRCHIDDQVLVTSICRRTKLVIGARTEADKQG